MSDGEEDDNFEYEQDLTSAIRDLNLRQQQKQIRQELTDPYNRLHSISLDAEFVGRVSNAYPDFPVVGNLRCGAWYVKPDGLMTIHHDVYFKSTDGHAGQWAFSLRRPNLGVLGFVVRQGGVIIVDSTRRGKRYPDALSKTIPIWCSVINRAICIKHGIEAHWSTNDLDFFSPASVSSSEREQIRTRLQAFAVSLAASSYELPILSKPLRPLHISPATNLPIAPLPSSIFHHFFPVICVTASIYTGSAFAQQGGFNYVPGSGDDHESWAPDGFTPSIFWANKERILGCDRRYLPDLLSKVISHKVEQADDMEQCQIVWVGDTCVGFTTRALLQEKSFNVLVSHEGPGSAGTFVVNVPTGSKKHLRAFSEQLPDIAVKLREARMKSSKILIVCGLRATSNVRDVTVGIALVALVHGYDEAQQPNTELSEPKASKTQVMRCLEWIIASTSGNMNFNPSRGILQRVNSFLCS